MKILLDIKDNKVSFVMELLNSLSFVKVQPLTGEKAKQMSDIREAVEEIALIKEGKKQARNAEDFVNEL